ncbi:MAG: hypothetical protein KOO63_08360 [Bacteroidales bacterium]|nr:hypothetical protein [Candidatus Latescibacterota bacterium]
MHNFNDSLKKSHAASDHPMWLHCYKQFFPNMLACVDHRQDGEHQRAGIDRSVILENSKQILIDEKVRYKDYGDILLEYTSVDTTGAPGWACKPLMCDYIAYAILPRGKAYLLPVIPLQRAWASLGANWIKKYGTRQAQNNGYKTLNCPVPFAPLFNALQTAQIANFEPINQEQAA